jgi:hypothetical protein
MTARGRRQPSSSESDPLDLTPPEGLDILDETPTDVLPAHVITDAPTPVAELTASGLHISLERLGMDPEMMGPQFREMLTRQLPAVLQHFYMKHQEYGEEGAYMLGARGQYADVNRKVIKLKRTLWDGHPVQPGSESMQTVVSDLIGHCLLTLNFLDRGRLG